MIRPDFLQGVIQQIGLSAQHLAPKQAQVTQLIPETPPLIDKLSDNMLLTGKAAFELFPFIESQLPEPAPLPGVIRGAGATDATVQAVKTVPGAHWVGTLESNGGREVALMVPEGVDLRKPVQLVYYFHGHHGTIARGLTLEGKGFGQELPQMAQAQNAVFVIPQGPAKSRDYTWMNPKFKENMATFQSETQALLKQQFGPDIKVDTVTMKGHSAGGLPLMNGAISGMQADRVDYLDASYGWWASNAYQNQRKTNPDIKFNLVYIPGTSTAKDALRLKGKPGVNLINSKVSHSAVPKTFLNH